MKKRHLWLLVLSFITSICVCFSLAACKRSGGDETTPVALNVPVVSIDSDGVATWDAVPNASGYAYKINDGEEKTSANRSVTLTDKQSISVKAVGDGENYTDSEWSQAKTYTAPTSVQPVKLGTPVVALNGAVASWEAVENASGYKYSLDNGATWTDATGTSVTLTDKQTVIVKAIGDGENYTDGDASAPVTYNAAPVPVKLGTPVVTIDEDGLASWEAVSGATKYKVDVDGVVTEQAKTTKQLDDGAKIKVQAVGNGTTYLTGDWSAEKTYNAPSELPKLDAPKVTINNETGLVSWAAVDHATGYVYKIGKNGEEHLYDENDPIILTEDEQTVYVKAVAEGYQDSDWDSETYSPIPDNPELKDLGTPVVKIIENNGVGTASWTAIEGATHYTYRINGGEIQTTTELSVGNLQPGDSVIVRAWSENPEYEEKGSACEEVVFYAKLATPVVTLTGAVASWEAVPGATSYVYKTSATGTEKTATGNTVTLMDGQSIQVKAKGNPATHKDSDWSTAKTYTAPQPTKLKKPLITMSETGLASWKAVPNATKYTYKINGGEEIEVAADATLSVQLKHNESIVVTAIGDVDNYLDSDPSAAKSYIVSALAASVSLANGTTLKGTPTAEQAVWEANGITVTSDKADASYGCTNYKHDTTDHARFYKSSNLTIAYESMVKVVFNCTSGNAPESKTTDDYTLIVDGTTATVIFNHACDDYTFENLAKAFRATSIDVYTAKVAQALDTPANLTIDEYGVATWDAVKNAVRYAYRINDGEKQYTDVRSVQLEDGQSIKVSAVGDGVDYKLTNTPTGNKTYTLTPVTLVVEITLNDGTGVATWGELKGAKEYVYTVLNAAGDPVSDQTNVKTETPVEITLSENYTLIVKAIGDGTVYLDSDDASEKYEIKTIYLDKPSVVVESDGTVKLSCENALSFNYTVDGETNNVKANAVGAATLDKLLAYGEGVTSKTIVVQAMGNSGDGGNVYDSTETTSVTYVKPGTLTAPKVTVTYEGTTAGNVIVSWTGDSHATGYRYSVDSGDETTVAAGVTSLTLENFTENVTVVKIIAIGIEQDPTNGADYSNTYKNSESEKKLIIDKTATYSVSEIIKVMNFYGSTFPEDNFIVQGVVSNSSYASGKYEIFLYNDIANSEGKKQEKAFEFYNPTFDETVNDKYTGADYQTTDAFKNYTITATGKLAVHKTVKEFSVCTISNIELSAESLAQLKAEAEAAATEILNSEMTALLSKFPATAASDGSFDYPTAGNNVTITWTVVNEGDFEDDEDFMYDDTMVWATPQSIEVTIKVTAELSLVYIYGEDGIDTVTVTTEELSIIVPAEGAEQLTKPVVTITEGVATWDAIEGATGYKYKINGVENAAILDDDHRSVSLEAGQSIQVQAVGNGSNLTNSDWSDIVTYTDSTWKKLDAALLETLTTNNELIGKKIVITTSDGKTALSTEQKSNNRGAVSYNMTDEGADPESADNAVCVLEIVEGAKDGTYALKIVKVGTDTGTNNKVDNYLCAASSSGNYLKSTGTLDANSSCSITISDAGVTTIKFEGSYSHNVMQYNSSSKLFACYGSASQSAIAIYIYA